MFSDFRFSFCLSVIADSRERRFDCGSFSVFVSKGSFERRSESSGEGVDAAGASGVFSRTIVLDVFVRFAVFRIEAMFEDKLTLFRIVLSELDEKSTDGGLF